VSEASAYLQIGGQKVGPYDIRKIGRLYEDGKVDRTAPMWRESRGTWGTVADVPEELMGYDSEERLRQIAESSIQFVEVLPVGDERDCPVCVGVRGLKFPIAAAPPLPLPCCSCEPWHRCVYIAADI